MTHEMSQVTLAKETQVFLVWLMPSLCIPLYAYVLKGEWSSILFDIGMVALGRAQYHHILRLTLVPPCAYLYRCAHVPGSRGLYPFELYLFFGPPPALDD